MRRMNQRSDENTTLGTLKQEVLAFAQARDWEQFHSPKNLSMAISAEAAELMEPLLWVTPEESRAVMARPDKRAALQDELADIVVYCLEFANQTGIDLASAITAKMARNAQKYPVEKARGRSEKYNEL
jgi:NTP pyrophosphatase (non-canonical NTP hydrolase)